MVLVKMVGVDAGPSGRNRSEIDPTHAGVRHGRAAGGQEHLVVHGRAVEIADHVRVDRVDNEGEAVGPVRFTAGIVLAGGDGNHVFEGRADKGLREEIVAVPELALAVVFEVDVVDQAGPDAAAAVFVEVRLRDRAVHERGHDGVAGVFVGRAAAGVGEYGPGHEHMGLAVDLIVGVEHRDGARLRARADDVGDAFHLVVEHGLEAVMDVALGEVEFVEFHQQASEAARGAGEHAIVCAG